MTVYYQDHEIRVTDRAIELAARTLLTNELSYVWHTRGQPTAQTTSRQFARFGLIVLMVLPIMVGAMVAGILIGADHGLPAQIGLAAVFVLIGVLLLALLAPVLEFPMMALERSYDRGTSVHEIWVRWHHHDLLLLRTSDAARFGKIYRAIQRAVERADA